MQGKPLGQEHVEIVRRHDVILPLVRGTGQEEAEDLERHQPSGLTGRSDQLKNGADALFGVESRDHGGRELGQEGHQQLQDVVDVIVFVHGGQVVEDALQFVLLAALAHHGELFEEEQDEGADAEDVLLRGPDAVQTLGRDP